MIVSYKHPYETEISRLEYPERLFQEAEPIPYHPAETTKAIWVDTFEGVLEMLQELKGAKEIAVDLEHHDFRTYNGLVCLMQISTREQDWIVDTLRPWRHKLQVLNEVFADPSIIKVCLPLPIVACTADFIGVPRCIYGYDLASARSRLVC
jgi:exosome complex exonuclease RRP6